jgi:hypothetical protein
MTRAFRPAALLAALTAMLLGAMLPQGWMPGAGGAPVMCSLDTPVHHAPDQQSPGQPAPHHECPFAAAPHVSPPLAAAVLAAPRGIALVTRMAAVAAPPALHTVFTPQSPRAPPQNA